ncbi:unnamed protein product [Brachionus calyciflorus]|uniref:FLYWCH-type domain-containing protein n=1 Tax=Brachionus calyciflorus TaxID=104777 RepID=A0A813SWI3_9BILA|nr:unnamed protein product [Brachionus calyciflorus]
MSRVGDFLFQRVNNQPYKDGSLGWRCQFYRSKGCKSSCNTIGDHLQRNPDEHNHSPLKREEFEILHLKHKIKKRSKEETSLSIGKIYREEVGRMCREKGVKITQETVKMIPKYANIYKGAYAQRRLNHPKYPITTKEISLPLEYTITN